MRSLYESLLDDEEDLMTTADEYAKFDLAAKQWLMDDTEFKSLSWLHDDDIVLDRNHKSIIINGLAGNMRIYGPPPKEVKFIDIPSVRIQYKFGEEISKFYDIHVLEGQEKLEDLDIHTQAHDYLYIMSHIKSIKDLRIHSRGFRQCILFHGGVGFDFEDLAEIKMVCNMSNPHHMICIDKKSKLCRTVSAEYKKLGWEQFNEKYKDTLDKLLENKILTIKFNVKQNTVYQTDLIYSPTKKCWRMKKDYP